MWSILFTAAAPPAGNKSEERKDKEATQPGPESSLRYSRLLRRPGCVAREACEPEEDPEAQPKYEGKGKKTPGQKIKNRGNAPSAPAPAPAPPIASNEGRKPFPLRWPKDCRGHDCMSKCRKPGTQFNRKLF